MGEGGTLSLQRKPLSRVSAMLQRVPVASRSPASGSIHATGGTKKSGRSKFASLSPNFQREPRPPSMKCKRRSNNPSLKRPDIPVAPE